MPERKRIFRQQPVVFALLLVLAVIAGCQISPRRVVNNTSPTPSPGVTPTATPTPGGLPTPSPTISPIPGTPTPSPMAAEVSINPQFVFVESSLASGSVSGFRIESDGSLSPLQQGKVALPEPAINMIAFDGKLAVFGRKRVSVFTVESATGTLRLSDVTDLIHLRDAAPNRSGHQPFVIAANDELMLQTNSSRIPMGITVNDTGASPSDDSPQLPTAVLTRDQRFMYALDAASSQLRAFRVEGSQTLPLTPAAYPVPKGTSTLTIVRMSQ